MRFRRLIALALFCQQSYAMECPLPPNAYVDNSNPGWQILSGLEIDGIFAESATLKAGQYTGQPFVAGGHSRPELRLWPDLFANGDLDGKSGDETIGLVSEASGGSGEHVYLVGAQRTEDKLVTWPAALVGDRVKVRALQIQDQRILLDIIEAGSNEGLCCGTQLTRQVWRLLPTGFVQTDNQVQGRLSSKELQYKRWYLLDRPGDRLQAVHPSCTYFTVDGDQAVIEVGGRQFVGNISEPEPGHIRISNTMPAVDINAADISPDLKLVSKLLAVNQYTFRAGRLLLIPSNEHRSLAFEFAVFE